MIIEKKKKKKREDKRWSEKYAGTNRMYLLFFMVLVTIVNCEHNIKPNYVV